MYGFGPVCFSAASSAACRFVAAAQPALADEGQRLLHRFWARRYRSGRHRRHFGIEQQHVELVAGFRLRSKRSSA